MWKYLTRRPHPKACLLLLPFAGGSSASYKTLARHIRDDVELLAFTPPGRGERFRDPPCADMGSLVDLCFGSLPPLGSLPCAIFGHSLGGLAGFELAQRIMAERKPVALFHLFASACRAPWLPEDEPFWLLEDREFLLRLRGMEGIADEIWNCPEFLDMLLPALRADFRINDTYSLSSPDVRPRLECPLTVFGGTDDERPRPAHLEPWRKTTAGKFRIEMFKGGHFFLLDDPEALAGAINRDLGSFLNQKSAPCFAEDAFQQRQTLP